MSPRPHTPTGAALCGRPPFPRARARRVFFCMAGTVLPVSKQCPRNFPLCHPRRGGPVWPPVAPARFSPLPPHKGQPCVAARHADTTPSVAFRAHNKNVDVTNRMTVREERQRAATQGGGTVKTVPCKYTRNAGGRDTPGGLSPALHGRKICLRGVITGNGRAQRGAQTQM